MRKSSHRIGAVACHALLCLSIPACTSAPVSTEATLSGTATYRERMALPPDAVFEATIEDVSRADASAEVVGRTQIDRPGQPPIRFTITYDPDRIDARHRYVLRARISHAGELMFTTDTAYPVLVAGQPNQTELLLRRVASGASSAASTATLVNTYWKLTKLGARPVVVGERQREPHLVLQTDQQRVAGFGGCNRLAGSYSLSGETLRFNQLAGTMMACADGMEQEKAFHDALSSVARWRIVGETLELFDAAGNSVAQFESRYLK